MTDQEQQRVVTVVGFIEAVDLMRAAQKRFFAARRADSETRAVAVIDAKVKEREVDRMLAVLKTTHGSAA